METHQDHCGYLERTMHIWAFVSKINQPSNYQPHKKPPGKTEEIQKTVEVSREEHYHRQRMLAGEKRRQSKCTELRGRGQYQTATSPPMTSFFPVVIYNQKPSS